MADYHLQGLNPRDFQHLIQAIARKNIAAGVTAFGDGKDGARDLMFKGSMNFPSHKNSWNGYLVLGCKFLQRPAGNSNLDGTWALRQLESDLKKFVSRKYDLPKPEYYIFATNISLSGVARIGSRDRSMTLLKRYKSKIGLKGFHVWDYNDIRGFLDGDQDIRSAYGHLITTGDVLAKLAQTIKFERVGFAEVMHSFLQKELISEMSAKLQAAGEDPDVQIPLAKVFVDLPFAQSSEAATFAKRKDESPAPQTVDYLLRAGSLVLRQTESDEILIFDKKRGRQHGRISRFVVVGGPGQGKSTVGQFLCQLYRAAILKDRQRVSLDQRASAIIKQLEAERDDFGGLPTVRRFPLRVELRAFSHSLGNDQSLTLFEYIRRDISRLGVAEISAADLKTWLRQYPWLLVLDGLDEVPPSSNRLEVMNQIEHFRIDAASVNADLLIVATTRPQSYSKEFSDDLFDHLYLMPLAPQHALEYGRKLAQVRCGEDVRRREELVRSLEKACRNEATILLMQSPLQVTIMATLLEDTGEPPQQRYRLFAEYYATIYRRETRRKLLGGILSERKTDIDIIHALMGLLLHLSGEGPRLGLRRNLGDGIESSLSDNQFRELVRARLEKIKVPASQLVQILDSITDSSLQRLVFLVRPEDGWVRFEITSLKEFMAAEAVMTGADTEVKQRLQTIAPAMYWRNVFLFATGKCFVQCEHLLDSVVGICADLNEQKAGGKLIGDELGGRSAKATRWGSRLALDILTDGTARQYPEYEVRLTKLALELIRFGEVETAARLASVYHDDLWTLYREAIEDRLGKVNFWDQLGAWHLILSLSDRDVTWAQEIATREWPIDGEKLMSLLDSHEHTVRREWWVSRIIATAPKVSPWWIKRLFIFEFRKSKTILPESWSTILNSDERESSFGVINRLGWAPWFSGLEIMRVQLEPKYCQELLSLTFEHPVWFALQSGARFSQDPTPQSLATELDRLSHYPETLGHFWFCALPWPLEACLSDAQSVEDLRRLAKLARVGSLGNFQDWKDAENRWEKNGITDDDFKYMTDKHWPFDREVAHVGFPLAASRWTYQASRNSKTQIVRITKTKPEGNSKALGWIASSILSAHGRSTYLDQSDLRLSTGEHRRLDELTSSISGYKVMRNWVAFDEIFAAFQNQVLSSDTIKYLDWLGRQEIEIELRGYTISFANQLVHHFCSDPQNKIGLLRIILVAVELGNRCTIPRAVLELTRKLPNRLSQPSTVLLISEEELTNEDYLVMASDLNHNKSRRNLVARNLKVAATISPDRKINFALAVLHQSTPDDEGKAAAIEEAREALVESLTRTPGNIDSARLLSDFGIPDHRNNIF